METCPGMSSEPTATRTEVEIEEGEIADEEGVGRVAPLGEMGRGYFVDNRWFERVRGVLAVVGGVEGEVRKLLNGKGM